MRFSQLFFEIPPLKRTQILGNVVHYCLIKRSYCASIFPSNHMHVKDRAIFN